jgi:putative hemolysin
MLNEIVIIILLILLNGFFSLSEMSLISSRKARLKKRADEGSKRHKIALQLSNSPGIFLSTAQIGITLIGILAGAFGGATVARAIEENSSLYQLSPHPRRESDAVVSAVQPSSPSFSENWYPRG